MAKGIYSLRSLSCHVLPPLLIAHAPYFQCYTGSSFFSEKSESSLSMSLSSDGCFIILVMLNSSALRHVIPVEDMIRAAQGWEKTNMAMMLFGDRCSRPPKTSRPIAWLLPTCPGGVGKMLNMLYTVYPKIAVPKGM